MAALAANAPQALAEAAAARIARDAASAAEAAQRNSQALGVAISRFTTTIDNQGARGRREPKEGASGRREPTECCLSQTVQLLKSPVYGTMPATIILSQNGYGSYCTIWYHIVQYDTILYNMVPYCTI